MEDLSLRQTRFREQLEARLAQDLVGPITEKECLEDRPTDRYLTGILYPQQSVISSEEDETLGVVASQDDAADDDAVSLVSTTKPSSAGISFTVEGGAPKVDVVVKAAIYRQSSGEETDGATVRLWTRVPIVSRLPALDINPGAQELSLESVGAKGLSLYVQATSVAGSRRNVTLALVNAHSRGATRNESEERTFFQVELEVRAGADTRLVARPSRKHAMDDDGRAASLVYRNAKEYATGHTCAAAWELDGDVVASVRTAWIPRAVVPAVSPHGDVAFSALAKSGKLRAAWLGQAQPEELVGALMELVAAYRAWITAKRDRVGDLDEGLRTQATEHLDECEAGAKRMAASVSAIADDRWVRDAFQLAQRAMELQRQWAEGSALTWRPFQLAFQLLVIDGLADRHHRDREVMDLLWFPTGGGKTEAYLALTAFTLFIRRFHASGPDDGGGVAVLMRYTLRLLTVQQFQRATTMVMACEHLRRTAGVKELGAAPFAIGLWVGNTATPGTVAEAMKGGDGVTHKQLTSCPCCGGPLDWDFPRRQSRVRCGAKGSCALQAGDTGLPIYTIDEDVYRETPSLLIGTVDKFAQIVRRPDAGRLFARGTERRPPDLVIQDELHLISGPLGTVTGLYETAIDELCSQKSTRPKVIGSTATIRRANDQIRALFARRAFQFPPPGIDDGDSGFAVIDKKAPGRLYLGLSTAGRSAKYAVQALAATLLQAVAAQPAEPEVRDPFWTLVAYFNTLRELGGSLVLMQDDVPVSVQQLAGRHPPETARTLEAPAELTSRVSSAQIRTMLDDLAIPAGQPGAHDILLASNMISVGVDIPRLGLMMVVGQPKTISEYIQATSRVGRRSPGLVVALYNAGRVRDRAHFETFATWHQTLYREVEATSVTPFASRAQDKALHAVLVAMVRHLVPGMLQDPPRLSPAARAEAERLVQRIEERVKYVDSGELKSVGERLRKLLDAWESDPDLQKYWDDYGKSKSLLISAEQHAAAKAVGATSTSALWPTPNSMREVEPGTPFVLVEGLRAITGD